MLNKKIITQLFAWVLTMSMIFSCKQPVAGLSGSEKAETIKDARQMLDNYYKDIRKLGLTAEFKYLDSSSDFFWVPPGFSQALSYDSVAAILNRNAPAYKMVDNGFDTLRVIPLTKELVTYTGRLSSAMTDTSGKSAHFSLAESGVLIKRRGEWKLLCGQTTLISAGH